MARCRRLGLRPKTLFLSVATLVAACGGSDDGPPEDGVEDFASTGGDGGFLTAGTSSGGGAPVGGQAPFGVGGDATASGGGPTGVGGVASGGVFGTGGDVVVGSGGMVTGSGGLASGGAVGTGSGGADSGGTGGVGGTGGASDCNGVTDQPIIEVAQDGSGQHTTVQAALDSISTSNTTRTQIRIAPGNYYEKLVVDTSYVTLCGQTGQAASTVLTYSDNANTPDGNGGTVGTSGSASTNISASNVSAENITFENSTPLGGSQAVALRVTGSQVQFRSCRFLSYQDTLYVHSGSQYFRECYIQGSVDFIFGGATAAVEDCTVHNAAGGTAVTAPSTEQTMPFGIVFLGGELTAASSVSSGSVALGRNWRSYGATAYIRTVLGAHISAVGWVPMGDNTLDTARFSEYETTGPGANPGARAPQSTQLTAQEASAYTVENIFGSWIPSLSQ